MKVFLITILIVVLVILFGTFPLSILAKIFNYLKLGCEWLAKILNIFGWNGIIKR